MSHAVHDVGAQPGQGRGGAPLAIFHASVRTISRASGRSATAAAAYRAGVTIHDTRDGMTHDYTRKRGVVSSAIVLPAGAGQAFRDRSTLWNAAEAAERRKDARVARELILALPHELDEASRAAAAVAMGEWLAARYGVAADVSIHQPDRAGDGRNHHAHILFTTRQVGADGMGAKTRQLDDQKTGPLEVEAIRAAWEQIANSALERAGSSARIDRRSHAELGIELPPQIHEGVRATQMRRRGVEPKGSVVVVDFRGREIDYPAIDMGRTRGEYNAEIINLQEYRDALQEQREQEQAELKEEEILENEIFELQEKAVELHGSIEALEAALANHSLSDNLRARIRHAIERAVVAIFYRQQHETEYVRAKAEAQRQHKEAEEKRGELQRVRQEIEQLRERQRQIQAQYAANRELAGKIERMGQGLALPAAGIRLEIPLTMRFVEASMQGATRKQSAAELLKAVTMPPPLPSKPELAPLQLRAGVLQVKELLARSNPPRSGAGAAAISAAVGFSMRK